MNEYKQFVRPEVARRVLKLSNTALQRLANAGKIESIRTAGNQRRYNLNIARIEPEPKPIVREKICYARVSTHGQKEDLERQIKLFREKYPNHRIVKDIGSGLNFKRKGFQTVLDLAIKGSIEEIVVTNKDRLCRFGFELVEGIVSKQSNGSIVVLNNKETSPQQELADDLISIITVFSARLYGLRAYSVKKEIKQAIRAPKLQDCKDQSVSDGSAKTGN